MIDQGVYAMQAKEFIPLLPDKGVKLLAIDPPYYGIVKESWDNQWVDENDYATWLVDLLTQIKPKMHDHGSILMFGGIGSHGKRPLFNVMQRIESTSLYQYRNWLTWKKRRAYGKSHDYLFCREEILWYSVSAERKEVTFNVPLTDTLRGYSGFDPKYKAKSEFKRVSNVMDDIPEEPNVITDIPELMRPERTAQKPLKLLERLINTHSNENDVVVDIFAGWGTTAVAAARLKRQFYGCEALEEDASAAQYRFLNAETLLA